MNFAICFHPYDVIYNIWTGYETFYSQQVVKYTFYEKLIILTKQSDYTGCFFNE